MSSLSAAAFSRLSAMKATRFTGSRMTERKSITTTIRLE
jgi:hypothetical protein